MTKYEELIKQTKNKDSSVDAIAKKYKMAVLDVKIMQEWKEKYKKEHKLRQEAEGETTIVKGIGQNSPEMKTLKSEVEALKQQLHTDREKYKKENNDLFNRVADSLEVNESHQKMNGKLQERLTEVEEENKKMHDHFDNKIDSARKAGL